MILFLLINIFTYISDNAHFDNRVEAASEWEIVENVTHWMGNEGWLEYWPHLQTFSLGPFGEKHISYFDFGSYEYRIVITNGMGQKSYYGIYEKMTSQRYMWSWLNYTATFERLLVNNKPLVTLTIANQTLSEVNRFNLLNINGTVKDSDIGDTLTIKYTIDGIPTHTNQTIATLTANGVNQPFSHIVPINHLIPEGNHQARVWVEDNKGAQVIASFNIQVRKTPPSPAIISASPSGSSSTKTISIAYDSNATKREYQINDGEWILYNTPFVINQTSKITARSTDAVGNASTSHLVVEVAPPEPVINILQTTESTIEVMDQQIYVEPVEWRFSAGSKTSGWIDQNSYSFINLSPNTKFPLKVEVRYK